MKQELDHMEQHQHGKAYPKIGAEEKSQYNPPSYNWSEVFSGAWHDFSPVYLPNLWVTLAFALIGPGIGLIMKNPKVIIYGSGAGVCVLVMVFTYFLAQQFSETTKSKEKPEAKETKTPDKVAQPSLPPKTISKPPSIAIKKEKVSEHSTHTAYSQLTNEQLKDAVLNFTPKIRIYVQQKYSIDMNRTEYFSQLMRQAKTEEERHRIREMQSREYTTAITLNSEYGSLFKAEAMLLHEELLKRLLSEPRDKRSMQADYEHPTNPIGLNMVIDDLEKLAKSLPK